eukprot:3936816-Rhodomonas_salina.1
MDALLHLPPNADCWRGAGEALGPRDAVSPAARPGEALGEGDSCQTRLAWSEAVCGKACAYMHCKQHTLHRRRAKQQECDTLYIYNNIHLMPTVSSMSSALHWAMLTVATSAHSLFGQYNVSGRRTRTDSVESNAYIQSAHHKLTV